MTPQEIEKEIKDIFDRNYEMLKLEGGHALTGDVRQAALQQVLFYYRKLQGIAEKVTETEVKLTLPDQKTPDGRPFTIEGVVDIVREDDHIWMYDIKTHDPEYIAANKDLYEDQLNVYAHIYQTLRCNQLDHTAIIATSFPRALQLAIAAGDPQQIQQQVDKWDPVIELEFDHSKVKATIKCFGQTVDDIESNRFEPCSLETLKEKVPGTNTIFATRVCRNCDTRFSCESYRQYALQTGARSASNFKKYFEDYGDELQQEEFITANINLDKINTPTELER